MEPITIPFTLTEDDYIRSYRQFFYRNMNYYAAMSLYFAVVLASVIMVLALWDYFNEFSDWVPFLLATIAFVAYLCFESRLRKRWIRSDKQPMPGSLEFSEQGVKVKNEMTESNYTWQNFRDIYENAEFFYVILANRPKMFLFLPKRLFTSPTAGTAPCPV